jgi:predicted deacylase
VLRLVGHPLALGLLLSLAGPAAAHPAWQRPAVAAAKTKRQQKRFAYGAVKDPTVALASAYARLHALAGDEAGKMQVSTYGQVGAQPLVMVRLPAQPRPGGKPPLRVLVSAGVHGDEPSGVLAAVEWISAAMKDRGLRERFDIVVLPAVNPTGLVAQTRVTDGGQDVNRTFPAAGGQPSSPESQAVHAALGEQTFDLFVDLHGARSQGFFLIRGKDDGPVSGKILSAMASPALMGPSHSDSYAMHTLGGATSSNSGTFKDYMRDRGARYSYTLEYPRLADPAQQKKGIMKLLRSAMENVRVHGR